MSSTKKWFISLSYLVHLLCHAAFFRIISKDLTSFLMISSPARIHPDKHTHMNLLKAKVTSVMIFHHDIFLQASISSIQIDTSPNDMFCQGSSSLPEFYQSLHILPGDILVTSSWLPGDNCLLSGCTSWSLPLFTFFIPRNLQFFNFLVHIQPPHIPWGHIMLISSVHALRYNPP